MWGGFHAGEMAVTRDETGDSVRTAMTLRTVGMFARLLPLRFAAEGTGLRRDDGLISTDYRTRIRSRWREQLLQVSYGPPEPRVVLDEILAEFAPLPDNEPVPEVPPEARRNTGDPLTNVARLGPLVRRALDGGGPKTFRTGSYDGRRAYDFEVTVKGPKTIDIHDRGYDAVELSMVLRPVAGFKPRFAKLWGGAEYLVHLDPATMLPLRIYTESFAAATVINVVAPCRVAAEQCAPLLAGDGS